MKPDTVPDTIARECPVLSSNEQLEQPNGRYIRFGVRWRAPHHEALWGLIKYDEAIDLDAVATSFAGSGRALETVYYGHRSSQSGGIELSGDDATGTIEGVAERDNESIMIDTEKIRADAESIFLYVNSYDGKELSQLQTAEVNIYTSDDCDHPRLLAKFNFAQDDSFKNSMTVILGRLQRQPEGGWSFKVLDVPAPTKDIVNIIGFIQANYYQSEQRRYGGQMSKL